MLFEITDETTPHLSLSCVAIEKLVEAAVCRFACNNFGEDTGRAANMLHLSKAMSSVISHVERADDEPNVEEARFIFSAPEQCHILSSQLEADVMIRGGHISYATIQRYTQSTSTLPVSTPPTSLA